MNNISMLKQARDGLINTIHTNPKTVVYVTYPLVDNGEGIMVFDFSQPEITKNITIRVALNQKGVVNDTDSSVLNSTDFGRCILADYRTPLIQGAVLRGLEREYVLGEITPLMKFGGIYGYQADITEGSL